MYSDEHLLAAHLGGGRRCSAVLCGATWYNLPNIITYHEYMSTAAINI